MCAYCVYVLIYPTHSSGYSISKSVKREMEYALLTELAQKMLEMTHLHYSEQTDYS